MKLVELLARDLDSWADTTVCYVQDPCGKVWPCMETAFRDGNSWCGDHGLIDQSDAAAYFEKAATCEDHDSAIVTRDQWQAAVNKLIQPQENPVEMKGPFPTCPRDQAATELEWDLICPSGVVRMKPKTDQIDGPIKWRDQIVELEAHEEDIQREIASLHTRLTEEGFSLVRQNPSVQQPELAVDMSDWRNWKIGDIILVSESSEICDGEHAITYVEPEPYDGALPVAFTDGNGAAWPEINEMKFIRRP